MGRVVTLLVAVRMKSGLIAFFRQEILMKLSVTPAHEISNLSFLRKSQSRVLPCLISLSYLKVVFFISLSSKLALMFFQKSAKVIIARNDSATTFQ
jgi:hypothetical protein